jgi:hypothetical protein
LPANRVHHIPRQRKRAFFTKSESQHQQGIGKPGDTQADPPRAS